MRQVRSRRYQLLGSSGRYPAQPPDGLACVLVLASLVAEKVRGVRRLVWAQVRLRRDSVLTMNSKNKPRQSTKERIHTGRVKEMACGVCGAPGPSEAHELVQGYWYTVIPLCADCHRGSFNGLHGQKRIWEVLKKTEMSVLNETIGALVND